MRHVLVALLLSTFAVGCEAPSLLITPVTSSNKLEEISVSNGKGLFAPKIALIEVEGMLANARSEGLLGGGENPLSLFTQELELAAKDDAVKAVVLRVNSPGGTVTCSDTMYEMVKEFRATTHKPVVASAQELCASGAFYVSCASDAIVAQPTSIVGSIGVIFESFDVSGTMKLIGLRSESVVSGPLKDMGSPFKPLDPDARAVMQGMVDEYYARFLGVVKGSRTKLVDADKIKSATDGRVFSGEQALKLGLVDRVGRLDDAINLAKEMSNSPKAQVIMYRRPYGYSGSIYAESPAQPPKANVMTLQLPQSQQMLPAGFYYLWMP